MAQREIGLAAGELPTARGYTPSVFTLLPRLLERGGVRNAGGTMTALYTVLVEGDDVNEPISDAVRSILDGHIVLSRQLAQAAHYPAIDVLASASRVFTRVAAKPHREAASQLRALMARHTEVEFLLRVGEYQAGSDPLADRAIERMPAIKALLQQRSDESADFDTTIGTLQETVS
jgi:type III secretion protein N (ATPase)